LPFGVLLSVFLIALLGGMHCAAMCGGIAIVAEQNLQQQAPVLVYRKRQQWLFELCVMHAGRITTYMLLGALMGAVGGVIWKQDFLPLQRWLYAGGSALLVLTGVFLLLGRTLTATWIERTVTAVAQRSGVVVRAFARSWRGEARQALPNNGAAPFVRRWIMGLAWGIVPCGMVYSALSIALLAGNAVSGALVMAAFGIGTLPNLLVISGLSGALRQLLRKRGVRTVAALVVIGFGLAGMVRAAWIPDMLAQHGFCLVF